MRRVTAGILLSLGAAGILAGCSGSSGNGAAALPGDGGAPDGTTSDTGAGAVDGSRDVGVDGSPSDGGHDGGSSSGSDGGTGAPACTSGLGPGGAFGPSVEWQGGTFSGSLATRVGDVDGDGKADAIAFDGAATWVMLSTGSSFGPALEWQSAKFSGSSTRLVGDVDG
ncbi:MAG TPA: hypothetical protein VHS09_08640, partial [Polyangiaceae bacterium]|nr:hypothetical protein [Polyangiaceae bacterium]